MVVDVEVAGEAGAGELGSRPTSPSARWVRDQERDARGRPTARRARPAASSASSAHAVCEAVDVAAADPRRVVVGAQVLAPAAVGVLVRRRASRPRARIGGRRGVDAGRDQRRHDRAGAVDVVGAPAAEPRPVGLLRARAASATPRRHAGASGQALGGEHLDDVRGDVGRRRVDHLAEVAERQLRSTSLRVLSASNAPQPPSRDCMPSRPRHAALDRGAQPSPAPGARRGAAPAPPRRCRRCRGSRRCRTRRPSRPGASPGRRTAQSPGTRISSPSSQSARGEQAGSSGGDARVEQRGQRQAGVPDRRLAGLEPAHRAVGAVLADEEAVQPGEPGAHRGVVEGVAEQVQRHQRVHPRRLDAAPATPSASWRARIHSAARRIASRRSGRIGRRA